MFFLVYQGKSFHLFLNYGMTKIREIGCINIKDDYYICFQFTSLSALQNDVSSYLDYSDKKSF